MYSNLQNVDSKIYGIFYGRKKGGGRLPQYIILSSTGLTLAHYAETFYRLYSYTSRQLLTGLPDCLDITPNLIV